MKLAIVPPAPPSAKSEAIKRIKEMNRPDGALQCARCGGRQTMTIRSGDRVIGGRLKPGTVIEHCICPHCWKAGAIVDLLPEKPRLIKPTKPRRTKPRIVK